MKHGGTYAALTRGEWVRATYNAMLFGNRGGFVSGGMCYGWDDIQKLKQA